MSAFVARSSVSSLDRRRSTVVRVHAPWDWARTKSAYHTLELFVNRGQKMTASISIVASQCELPIGKTFLHSEVALRSGVVDR